MPPLQLWRWLCGYRYPTDQASYTRYEMEKLKYRAVLIRHRIIVECSFSSPRIDLVRTERPDHAF